MAATALDFDGLPIIGQAPTWTLYRDPGMLAVRFHGDVDDDASTAWRSVALTNLTREGWPRFAFVAPTDGNPVTSLASRMRTAAFLRQTAQNVESVTIVSSTTTTFVIRTILRAAGASNVELVALADAPARLSALRATAAQRRA